MIEAVNIYSEKYGDASNDKSPMEEEDYDLSDPGTLARKRVFFWQISLNVFPTASCLHRSVMSAAGSDPPDLDDMWSWAQRVAEGEATSVYYNGSAWLACGHILAFFQIQ